jgi:ribosomal protein RSM22 (predicted rRNA methylase)
VPLISLPPELEAAIGAELRSVPGSQWTSAARGLSERYRAERDPRESTPRPLASGRKEALGYAALVLPAAYAQLAGAMSATAQRASAFAPTTMLDLGSGPGTALWAAAEQWPSLVTMHAWERESAFIELGRKLAAGSSQQVVRQARWRQVTLGGTLPRHTPRYDLIVIGHVLNEMDVRTRTELVRSAWERCAGVLLIVEPGTSAAFLVVREARDLLLVAGAHTLAPCAHDEPCPLVNDWCHFPQRLHRPQFQRRAKEASAGWEEAKFSYAAMARFGPDSLIWGRLIHQPQVNKAGAELVVSSREGIVRPRIPRRDRPAFKSASDLKWGDVLEEPVPGGG